MKFIPCLRRSCQKIVVQVRERIELCLVFSVGVKHQGREKFSTPVYQVYWIQNFLIDMFNLLPLICLLFFFIFLAERREPVTNCSKYVPHENRRTGKSRQHADAIATLLFGHGGGGRESQGSGGKGNVKKVQKYRKLFRQLRSSLNEQNGHLPDRYLALKRTKEMKCTQITAGYLSKSR